MELTTVNNTLNLTTLGIYLSISLLITVWVANTLFKNGRVFLLDAFNNNIGLADSVNKLLVVGFYLVNLGYVNLRVSHIYIDNSVDSVLFLMKNIGTVLVVLGCMHFFNIFVLSRFKNKNGKNTLTPQEA
ncbi:hypothetical protein K1X76_05860 [bacterium]|nr:hypothetical protein [bacterium]